MSAPEILSATATKTKNGKSALSFANGTHFGYIERPAFGTQSLVEDVVEVDKFFQNELVL